MPCQDQGLFLDHSAYHTQPQQPLLTAPAAAKPGGAGTNSFPSQGNGRRAVVLSVRTIQLQRAAAEIQQQSREREINASEGKIASS